MVNLEQVKKYEEILSQILTDIITDNKNRSVAEIRHILSKYSGKLAEIGSVSWMFEKEGQIILISSNNNQEVIFDSAIDFGAKDFYVHDGMYIISTQPDELMEIREHVIKYLKTLKEVTHHTNADESDELETEKLIAVKDKTDVESLPYTKWR